MKIFISLVFLFILLSFLIDFYYYNNITKSNSIMRNPLNRKYITCGIMNGNPWYKWICW